MMLHTPRLMFALSEKGDLPRFLARIHSRYRTPHISIYAFATAVWCLAAAGSFKGNVFLSSVARLLVLGFTCAALPVLRRMYPGGRGYRLPAGSLLALLGVLFTAILASRVTRGELVVVVCALIIAAAGWQWGRQRAA
jgi:amino acid transporter